MKNILRVLALVIVLAAFSSCNITDEIKEKYGVETQNRTGHEGIGDDADDEQQETGGKTGN